MECKDYRLTDYAPAYDIANEKAKLKALIKSQHPRKTDYYSAVRDEYKEHMGHVYNDRCAYCGVPISVVALTEFQMDHIVCKKGIEAGCVDEPKEGVNSLANIAFSCPRCNSNKHDFLFDGDCYSELCPDERLGETFHRDAHYRIAISEPHHRNDAVGLFYKRMRFDSELLRIDHLLAELHDLKKYLCDLDSYDARLKKEILLHLNAAFGAILLKRNIFSKTLSQIPSR